MKWLTHTREAYQFYRQGVGVWWSLAQATLMLLFIAVLFRRGNNRAKVALYTMLFFAMAVFLGSKASAIAYPVIAIFYISFCLSKIRIVSLIPGLLVVLSMFIALQLVQGTAETVRDALKYFDYFRTSAAFLDRSQQFGFRHGAVTLSNLWFYVPRALYPAKPFGYGAVMIDEWMSPGQAKHSGYTPGLLQWTPGYADFGLAGVIVYAVVTAWISKAVFEWFVERRDFLSLVLFAQMGFIYYIELFPNAPFPIFWGWFMAQGMVFWLLKPMSPRYPALATATD